MEMKRALDLLNENGISAQAVTVTKNGKTIPGIAVGSGKVRPAIYEDQIKGFTLDTELLEFVRFQEKTAPDWDIKDKLTKNYIMENAVSCIRPSVEDEVVSFPAYGDLQEYIRIVVENEADGFHGSFQLNADHLKQLELNASEIRAAARKNLRERTEIKPLSMVLLEFMGDEANVSVPEDEPVFVATNKEKFYGAAVMLLGDVLNSFCAEQGIKEVVIIPSSIHEILLVKEPSDPSVINQMIRDVNENEVAEEERLSDHCYIFRAS